MVYFKIEKLSLSSIIWFCPKNFVTHNKQCKICVELDLEYNIELAFDHDFPIVTVGVSFEWKETLHHFHFEYMGIYHFKTLMTSAKYMIWLFFGWFKTLVVYEAKDFSIIISSSVSESTKSCTTPYHSGF